jgi:hypothetical protein
MKWLDENTLFLSDRSIVVFSDTGEVLMYPSEEWKVKKKKNGGVHPFVFNMGDRTRAVSVFEEIEKMINKEQKC